VQLEQLKSAGRLSHVAAAQIDQIVQMSKQPHTTMAQIAEAARSARKTAILLDTDLKGGIDQVQSRSMGGRWDSAKTLVASERG
jgi:hypothetical protein